MYNKETSLPLLIIESFNVGVIFTFLILFLRRFCQLKQYSHTLRYQNYFPKLRILFVLSYVILGITLLSYNLASQSYKIENWYEYLLQGGGGECIDSMILLVQLGVLRFELNKQQPYTKYHLCFFVYIVVLESTRFIFTLLDVMNNQNDMANLIISTIITLDSYIQLVYWLVKRQSLPQFVNPIDVEIDDLSYHTRLIQSRNERSQQSNYKRNAKQFGYIVPNVGYENGKIKVILQTVGQSKKSFGNRTTRSGEKLLTTDQMDERLSPLLHESTQTYRVPDYLTISYFTHQQIKRLYSICGRYSIKAEIKLDTHSISQLIFSLKNFLEEVFSEQKCYQYDILSFFGLPAAIIREYQEVIDRYAQERSHLDKKMGLAIPLDQNAPYFSVVCYKYLWVYDQYIFYFKVTSRCEGYVTYPFKKYHDFEDLYHGLRKLLKTMGKTLELPFLLKKQNHNKHQNVPMHMLEPLELFFKKIFNDDTLMKIPQVREILFDFIELDHSFKIQPKLDYNFFSKLKAEAKAFSFDIRRTESLMFWEFSLLKGKEVIKILAKEIEELQNLDHQIKRFLKNTHNQKIVQLGVIEKREKKQKTLAKTTTFLQEVISIQNIERCYAATCFFDIRNTNKMVHNFKQKFRLAEYSLSENTCSERMSQESDSIRNSKNENIMGSELNRFSEIFSEME